MHLEVRPEDQRLQHRRIPPAGLWAVELRLLWEAHRHRCRQIPVQEQQETSTPKTSHPHCCKKNWPVLPGSLSFLLSLFQCDLLVRILVIILRLYYQSPTRLLKGLCSSNYIQKYKCKYKEVNLCLSRLIALKKKRKYTIFIFTAIYCFYLSKMDIIASFTKKKKNYWWCRLRAIRDCRYTVTAT